MSLNKEWRVFKLKSRALFSLRYLKCRKESGDKNQSYLPLKAAVLSPEVWEWNCYKHHVHFLLRAASLWEKRWCIEKALVGTGWMGTSELSLGFTLGFNFVRIKNKKRKHCPLWLRWVVWWWAGRRLHGVAGCCPWGGRDPTKPSVLSFFSCACRIPLWHLKWRIAFCKFSTDELAGILEVFPRQAS